VDDWIRVARQIHEDVCRHGYDAEFGSFVQFDGAKEVDASLLLIPAIGFLPASDPRVTGTIEAVERELLVDGFVHRYRTHETNDGLPPGEGAFLACSFWLADAYYLLGREKEAEELFERLIGLCNDVGLLSEEYDAKSRRHLGNFPQAFSHISLVNTAHNLSHEIKPAEERGR
jgi:GH15 family glucan-1,4-alpha-glucosidase